MQELKEKRQYLQFRLCGVSKCFFTSGSEVNLLQRLLHTDIFFFDPGLNHTLALQCFVDIKAETFITKNSRYFCFKLDYID